MQRRCIPTAEPATGKTKRNARNRPRASVRSGRADGDLPGHSRRQVETEEAQRIRKSEVRAAAILDERGCVHKQDRAPCSGKPRGLRVTENTWLASQQTGPGLTHSYISQLSSQDLQHLLHTVGMNARLQGCVWARVCVHPFVNICHVVVVMMGLSAGAGLALHLLSQEGLIHSAPPLFPFSSICLQHSAEEEAKVCWSAQKDTWCVRPRVLMRGCQG